MASLKTKRNLLSALAIGVLITFVVRMWQTGSIQAIVLTDVIVISYAIGELLQGWFVKKVDSANEESLKEYGIKYLSGWWRFVGFFFGILVAGAAGTLYSTVASVPSFATAQNATTLTLEATFIVVVSYLGKYGPRPKKRLREYFKVRGAK